MSVNDPAEFLEQLAAEVGALADRLDAAGIAGLESLLTPQSVTPRLGIAGEPSASSGQGDVAPATVIADGAVTTAAIADGAITMPKITAGAVDMTKFAQAIIPPRVVTALPTLPDDNFPVSSVVFLTTDEQLYKNVAGSWTITTEAELVANTLYAGAITAGAIGARELATVILLASLIKTANTGARVEIDGDGIRAIASDDTLLVNIPTDGSDVYVRAEIRALGLTVYNDAELRGAANVLAAGSSTALQAGISSPSVKPTLTQGWDTFDVGVGINASSRRGLAYYANGAATEDTPCFYELAVANSNDFAIVEYLASDLSINRYQYIESDLAVPPPQGITVLGGTIYVITWSDGRVYEYDVATLTLQTDYLITGLPVSPCRFPRLANDGTYLYVADTDTSKIVKWSKFNTSWTQQGSTVNTGYAIAGDRITDCQYGSFDFGAERMLVTAIGESTVRVFNSTGTRQSTEEFPLPSSESWGITWDGSNIITSGLQYDYEWTRHTAWTWTSASSIYWVGYSWYDSVGTTHETTVSPLQSITMGRRKRLLVTTPTEPGSGGADEPDNRRIYMYPNATSPATTLLDLQATTTEESHYITTYDSGGAAPPVSNDFPGGTPAELKSASGEWTLKGNGYINRTGTAFPSGNVTGDTFFRSDLGMEFFYNGTRWLSTQLFLANSASYAASSTYGIALNATQTTVHRVPLGIGTAHDIYVEDVQVSPYIDPSGTNLSASHKWVATVNKVSADNTATSLGTISFDSGDEYWRVGSLAVDTVLGTAAEFPHIRIDWAKTGSPGNLTHTVPTVVTYRIVAT